MPLEKFEQIYRRDFDRIYRYALSVSGNDSTAEEVTQEAFAKLLQNGLQESTVREPTAWLFRVARNLIVDHFRREAKIRKASSPPAAVQPQTPESTLQERQLKQRVLGAIRELSPNQRECITLREYGQLTYREIAQQLGTSVDQVKTHLHRARRHLRRKLLELKT